MCSSDLRESAEKVFAAVHPDDLQQHLDSIAASAQDLSPWRNEYRVQFPGEAAFWVQGSALPQREADGTVVWHGFITEVLRQFHCDFSLAAGQSSDSIFSS